MIELERAAGPDDRRPTSCWSGSGPPRSAAPTCGSPGTATSSCRPGSRGCSGHETAGEVVEVGAAVTGYAVGDRVVGHPQRRLRAVRVLPAGAEQHVPGLRGLRHHPGRRVRRVPAGARRSRCSAATCSGCPTRCPSPRPRWSSRCPAACAARTRWACGYGDVVVVIGAGPIGIFHVMLARLAGARKIIVVEPERTPAGRGQAGRRRRAGRGPARGPARGGDGRTPAAAAPMW